MQGAWSNALSEPCRTNEPVWLAAPTDIIDLSPFANFKRVSIHPAEGKVKRDRSIADPSPVRFCQGATPSSQRQGVISRGANLSPLSLVSINY